jgi:hypothetical protein
MSLATKMKLLKEKELALKKKIAEIKILNIEIAILDKESIARKKRIQNLKLHYQKKTDITKKSDNTGGTYGLKGVVYLFIANT